MTTRDFIAKTFDTRSDRERRCSSVFTDYNGTVFSYGYHYPLLFKVNGLSFVNVRGYSNTTAKHIGWARSAEPDAIPVILSRDDRAQFTDIHTLVSRLHEQRDNIAKQMQAKTRKDTQVYKSLFRELMQVDRAIRQVQEATA